MPTGYLSLVLHAHLPFVRHPEHREFFEERWLFEAITECYLPLIRVLDGLVADGVKFRIAISLSPTLVSMLEDELLQQRYIAHTERLIELACKEVERTEGTPFHPIAQYYRERLLDALRLFRVGCEKNIIRAFIRLRAAGVLELMTTTATHGFLPLLKTHREAVRAQVQTGANCFRRVFGDSAAGIWLPECGYYPGLEKELGAADFRWFIVDAHGILNGTNRPHYGLYAPIACENGVAAFGRDPESSRQVWSSTEGYPGDFDYREFHKDIGHELDLEYLAPYLLDGKIRIHTGLKYWRVTGRDEKEPYDPEAAKKKAGLHAAHFLESRRRQAQAQAQQMDRPPLILSPYDAELYGHWWWEGPIFLDQLIRQAARQDVIQLITPSDYLARHPVLQRSTPSASTWGWQGYNDCWLSGCNEWIYPHLHHAARLMTEMAVRFRAEPPTSPRARMLRQAMRSLLLAQSSDWPFIMKCGTNVEYANRRIRDQLARFHHLVRGVNANRVDMRTLRALELMDNVFPQADYRHYAGAPTADRGAYPTGQGETWAASEG